MYSTLIFTLGVLPTLLLFVAARFEPPGVGAAPLKIMGWTFLLGYTLKSIYLSFAVVLFLPFRPNWISFYVIDVGQLGIFLGVVGMLAGYAFGTAFFSGYRTVTPVPRATRIDARLFYIPFFLLSLLLLSIYFQRIGFLNQILSGRFVASKFFVDEDGQRSALGFLTIGGDFLLVLFIYYLAMARKITLFNIYTLSLFFLLINLFLASRRNVILVIIILALIVLAVRSVKRDPFKRLFRFSIILVTLIGVSFASQIRDGSRDGQTLAQLDVVTALQATTVHAFEGAYFVDPAKTAAIITLADDTSDLLWGSSFLGFIVTPIPRVLWPEKPSVRIAPYIAQNLFDFGNFAGVPPGAIGEAYLNFGWPGIAAVMFILGFFLAYLWWRHCHAEDPRFTIVRYAFIMIGIIYFLTVEFSAGFVIFIKYYIAILVAERYWRFRLAREGRLMTHSKAEGQPVPNQGGAIAI